MIPEKKKFTNIFFFLIKSVTIYSIVMVFTMEHISKHSCRVKTLQGKKKFNFPSHVAPYTLVYISFVNLKTNGCDFARQGWLRWAATQSNSLVFNNYKNSFVNLLIPVQTCYFIAIDDSDI